MCSHHATAGADDIEQLRELSEEEFSQLSALIGMDKKPFHVLRFRKALNKPPPASGVPLQSAMAPNPTTLPTSTVVPAPTIAPSTAISTAPAANYFNQSSSQLPVSVPQAPPTNVLHHPIVTSHGMVIPQSSTNASHTHLQGQPSRALLEALSANEAKYGPPKMTMQNADSNRPKASLPPYLMPNSECRTFDDLVDDKTPIQNALGPPPFSPSVWDLDRRELIRKYSAIYGKNSGDRRQKEALGDFEVHVNEAALQLCLRDPTLLVRREELYILSKRAVKQGGYAYYHGFSKTKESLNAMNSSATSGQKRPRSSDSNDLEEVSLPPAKLMSLKTALNIPSKLSVKKRLEHMQELENLIAENKSQQVVKLAALERAQQGGDFSSAYSIQLDVESLGMTCEQLQTAYTTLKKRQYRSVRYFKKKQEDKDTPPSMNVEEDEEFIASCSGTTVPNSSYTVTGTTVHISEPPGGPIQLIDTNILFSSPSISGTSTTGPSHFTSGGSISTGSASLTHKSRSKGTSYIDSVRPSPTVTATVIPSTCTPQQFDTRTHTVTVTVPSQDDSEDSAVRNLVENVSHATDEVNSLMIRELNKQLTWEDMQ